MSKQKWINPIVAVMLVITVLAGLVACGGPTLTPVQQYADLEGNALHNAVNSLPDTPNAGGSISSSTIDIIPSETLFALMGLQDMDMSWLEKVTLKMDNKVDGMKVNSLINLGMNDESLLVADLISNTVDGINYLCLPGIGNGYLKIDQNSITNGSAASGAASSAASVSGILSQLNTPEMKETKALLNKYIDIALANMTVVEKDTQKMTVGDKTQSVTIYTNYITEKVFNDIIKAVLTEAKTDETVKGILPQGVEIEAAIDQLIASMNPTPSEDKDEAVILKVYVNAKNEIIGRAFGFDRTVSISWLTLSDKDGSATEIALTADAVQYVLSGSVTAKGGSYSLSMRGDDQNITFGTLTYTGNSKTGSCEIKLSDFIEQNIFGSTEVDPALKISWNITDTRADIDLYLHMAGQQIIGIETASAALEGDATVTIPNSSLDITNQDHLDYYMSTIDLTTFEQNMRTAGVPEALIDSIMERFTGNSETTE